MLLAYWAIPDNKDTPLVCSCVLPLIHMLLAYWAIPDNKDTPLVCSCVLPLIHMLLAYWAIPDNKDTPLVCSCVLPLIHMLLAYWAIPDNKDTPLSRNDNYIWNSPFIEMKDTRHCNTHPHRLKNEIFSYTTKQYNYIYTVWYGA